ncbi:Retrovirus-related Pol polyprotein from transposon 17.6 [Cucumis melo var. makuwa]|uniref:Retrovirus-related Pol polyprotein from transposon 17.6 n=1 Tax=Cucumis melo var. makuwa TaxID=1194695 RepID=A0A5D3DS34_CUCMM|nr:Retrovirus-related Pol polyprotein from transposon 17.6 [Cucumis melo var. makuwa]
MVEGIVLGHKISNMGLEVDPAKIDVVSKLPPPSNVKPLRSFLGYVEFYRRFIKGFSQIAKPLSSVLVAPDWSQPFELMCDASDVVVGDMPGQKKDKVTDPIYYAIKTLNEAEENYTTIEKELLAIVFAIEKFRSYIVGSKVTIHSDHSAIRYLMAKKDAKSWLIR